MLSPSLRVLWAHLWAFGCYRIVVNKQGILFEYKMPYIGKFGNSEGFVHCWVKSEKDKEVVVNKRLGKIVRKIGSDKYGTV